MTPTREQIQQKAFRHWHRDRDNIEYFDAVSFWEEAFAAGQQAERDKLELVGYSDDDGHDEGRKRSPGFA